MANLIFASENTLREINGVATETILPGSVVQFNGAEFDLASADGADGALLVADYNMIKAGTVNDAWQAGETMVARQLTAAEPAYARVAAGQNIVNRYTGLAIGTDGLLRIAAPAGETDPADVVVAYADEIINTGASSALVRVRGK